ncbi:MAG: AraC family transcriptional regulator [Methylacidiphilales bacterium]|nr:AraC family transcriptional regulator [Candidatus Methylacidiphilales bacterium]
MIDWAHTRVEIGNLGRVRCEPGWRLEWNDPRFLRDFDLWFVRSGEGEMRLADRTVALRPGVCLWMRPGHTYIGGQNPRNRLGVTFIHFHLRCRGKLGRLPAEVQEVSDFQFFDAATRHIVELIQRAGPGAALRRLEAEELLRSVLIGLDAGGSQPGVSLSATQAEYHRRMRKIVSELLENCGDAASVAELARRTGYSPVHFSRVFKKVTGSLPREFIIQARLARARQLLRESSLSIGEIAGALGYSDVYFFSRQFKTRSGLSPTGFRTYPKTTRGRAK